MVASRAIAGLVLCAAWSSLPSAFVCVNAEEKAVGAADSAAEEAAARERIKAHDDKARAALEISEASNNKFLQSFQAAQKRLDGWKAQIEAAGKDADPVLVEKAAELEKDLKEMGIEYMKTVGEEGLGGSAKPPEEQDQYGALYGCVVLSVKELGQQRLSTQKSLQLLAGRKGDVVGSELAQDKLWRTVSVCIDSMTTEEYSAFKAGKLQKLPDTYVEAASAPEAEKTLLGLSAHVWKILQTIAQQVVEQPKGEPAPAPPIGLGMLAAIPVAIGIFFACRIYGSMQESEREKKSKKDKKEAKKSK